MRIPCFRASFSQKLPTAARDAQSQHGICDPIRRVADYIAFSGKVTSDTANPERFNRLDIRDNREAPSPA